MAPDKACKRCRRVFPYSHYAVRRSGAGHPSRLCAHCWAIPRIWHGQRPPVRLYEGLPRPAPTFAPCCRCGTPGALRDQDTGRSFCTEHWVSCVVQSQMD
jgi:hypothetical protein